MRHILTGVAVAAAVALSAPGWAQMVSPGGNAVGVPGPNPGGPGLTPYTTGPAQAPRPYTPPSPGTAVPPPPSAINESPSASPPSYPSQRRARAYRGRTGSRLSRGYSAADNSANQLNQAGAYQAAKREITRTLQSRDTPGLNVSRGVLPREGRRRVGGCGGWRERRGCG